MPQLVDTVMGTLRSHAGKLSMASIATQALQMLVLLALVPLYGKVEIGYYAVFLAYLSILLVGNTLAYHWSIPNVADADLRDLTALLVALAGGSAAAVGLAFGVAGYRFALALAILAFFRTIILVAAQMNIRDQDYLPLMAGQVLPVLLMLVLVIALPWLGVPDTAVTIVWTHTASYTAVGGIYGVYSLGPALRGQASPLSWGGLKRIALEERRFSLWVAPAQVFNRMAFEFPTVLVEHFLGAGTAAQYSMMLRICAIPLATVGGAVSQAYHGALARRVREKSGGVQALFHRARNGLLWGAVVVFLGTLFIAPPVAAWVLGPEWELVPPMIRWMSFFYAVMFLVGPLTVSFFVFEDQRFLFGHQLAFLVISLVSYGIGIAQEDLLLGVQLFCALSLVRFAVIYWRIHHLHGRDGP